MTKKSGPFELEVDLNLLKLEHEATVKHVKNNSKMIKVVIQIVNRQILPLERERLSMKANQSSYSYIRNIV